MADASLNKPYVNKGKDDGGYKFSICNKKYGPYIWNALDIFDFNEKDEVILRFSGRKTGLNLSWYATTQTAPPHIKKVLPASFHHIINPPDYCKHYIIDSRDNGKKVECGGERELKKETDNVDVIDKNAYRSSGFQRCSTPKDVVESQEDEQQDNDDDYQWTEFDYDPYESYNWEC